MTARIALPKTPHRRVSSDAAWPIRRADGQTPAQTQREYRPLVRPLIGLQPERRGWIARLVGRA